MDKQPKIGIIFSYNENWIGGTYYILNLIQALKTLDKPPILVIFHRTEQEQQLILDTKYPFLSFCNLSDFTTLPFAKKAINKICRFLFNKELFNTAISSDTCDVLFPAYDGNEFRQINDKIYWIPDFQEKQLPHFFSKEEIERRHLSHAKIAEKNKKVILSSNDALNDFNTFYPTAKCSPLVVPFAVTHPIYEYLNLADLLVEFTLPNDYYFSPNQFWKHKNHQIILHAVKLLKDQGVLIHIVFTGKIIDDRNPTYYEELITLINELDITSQIHILGFIDRSKQLCLMENSKAVIQPSLFEGWSTVIEDAKSLNKSIIASNIKIHQEQLGKKGYYFDPHDPISLGEIILAFDKVEKIISPNRYSLDVAKFANKFIGILNA